MKKLFIFLCTATILLTGCAPEVTITDTPATSSERSFRTETQPEPEIEPIERVEPDVIFSIDRGDTVQSLIDKGWSWCESFDERDTLVKSGTFATSVGYMLEKGDCRLVITVINTSDTDTLLPNCLIEKVEVSPGFEDKVQVCDDIILRKTSNEAIREMFGVTIHDENRITFMYNEGKYEFLLKENTDSPIRLTVTFDLQEDTNEH